MTDTQLYLSIGIPSMLALMNMAVMLTLFTNLSNRIQRIEQRLDDLTGAINELDKRLTKVEIKLGIQP
jgi:type II secretory pathway component PulJ